MIHNSDSLEFLRKQSDFLFDINYSDPPYALGSEVTIRSDGKVDYKNASDFMGKWKMPTGDYWEQWFKESYRTLKFGGTLIMFGMDRQLLLFKYYAQMAGFVEQQSMYWYYISGFPKATDLSKMIDKNLGVDREVVGTRNDGAGNTKGFTLADNRDEKGSGFFKQEGTEIDITKSNSDLGKKYEGYKYSIAPLKQTNETIMIFKKPYKTGSCLHDTLAMENGDTETTCGAVNIDGNRVATVDEESFKKNWTDRKAPAGFHGDVTGIYGSGKTDNVKEYVPTGRFPAQTFIDNGTAEVLDEQSGEIRRAGNKKPTILNSSNAMFTQGSGLKQANQLNFGDGDTGGCSKILHKIDLYIYQPKVNKSERNAGLDGFEEKSGGLLPMRSVNKKNNGKAIDGTSTYREQIVLNNHPTLKPINLNFKILRLYKTPNEQRVVYPFAGAGSEIIGGIKAGFNNWVGCEINPEYVDIANARIKYWTNEFSKKLL